MCESRARDYSCTRACSYRCAGHGQAHEQSTECVSKTVRADLSRSDRGNVCRALSGLKVNVVELASCENGSTSSPNTSKDRVSVRKHERHMACCVRGLRGLRDARGVSAPVQEHAAAVAQGFEKPTSKGFEKRTQFVCRFEAGSRNGRRRGASGDQFSAKNVRKSSNESIRRFWKSRKRTHTSCAVSKRDH